MAYSVRIYQKPLSLANFNDFNPNVEEKRSDFCCVWSNDYDATDVNHCLNLVFYLLNEHQPESYNTRSVSTGDIIWVNGDYYWVNNIGFVKIVLDTNGKFRKAFNDD